MTYAARVYGSDETDTGPEPGHTYRELVGWSEAMLAGGAYLMAPLSAYGPGGRASCTPTRRAHGPFVLEGDAPS